MDKDTPKSLERYFRKVIAHPEGAIVHYGDCSIYRARVCECGLISELALIDDAEKWYENFWNERAEHEKRIESLFDFKLTEEELDKTALEISENTD